MEIVISTHLQEMPTNLAGSRTSQAYQKPPYQAHQKPPYQALES